MVDPELVAIGAEAPARLTDLGVMPEPGGEGEEPQPDAGNKSHLVNTGSCNRTWERPARPGFTVGGSDTRTGECQCVTPLGEEVASTS